MPLFIMDVADVTFKRKSDGHVIFTSEAQMSSLSQTVDEETIQGGIGSRSIYTIKSNKELELTVRNATFDLEWMAMTQGVAIQEDESVTVQKKKTATVTDGMADAGDVTGDVYILNKDRKSQAATADAGTIEVPAEFADDGSSIVIIYEEDVTGQKISMRSDRFSEKYEVQYQTVVYDAETESQVGDLFIKFFEVSPSAAFDISLENGTAFTPELTFRATSNDASEIGEWVLVDK